MDKNIRLLYPVLLFSVLVIATCGILYELLLSSISSYFLGNSILQFSLTIGFFMFFMGIGSYLSKFINNNIFDFFVNVEIVLGILGGISAFTLYFAYAYTIHYYIYNFLFISTLGTLIGIEIPIVVRIINQYSTLKETIAKVLAFDYVGALVASLIFPLILLPQLGIFKTAFAIGILNLFVALSNSLIFRDYIRNHHIKNGVTSLAIVAFLVAFYYADTFTNPLEQKVFRDQIILKEHTRFQDLVITRRNNDYRLFINGSIQFSSSDEYRYHESLVHFPMATAKSREKVLVLGGGDGLAIREILKYADVKEIHLVDLDPAMTDLGQNNSIFKRLNHNSLNNPKVKIFNEDAFNFVKNSSEVYSVVIIDLPDPNNSGLGKLYTVEFYKMLSSRMAKTGVMITQATSPYFAREAYWCIYHSVSEAFERPLAFNANVPSFGIWGFVMAGKGLDFISKQNEIKPTEHIIQQLNSLNLLDSCKYLNETMIQQMIVFPNDMQEIVTEINQINTQKLVDYYLKSAKNWQ